MFQRVALCFECGCSFPFVHSAAARCLTSHPPPTFSYDHNKKHIEYCTVARMEGQTADPCLALDGEGVAYREFSCIYPQLENIYFG